VWCFRHVSLSRCLTTVDCFCFCHPNVSQCPRRLSQNSASPLLPRRLHSLA
jgi:hypothetical protein